VPPAGAEQKGRNFPEVPVSVPIRFPNPALVWIFIPYLGTATSTRARELPIGTAIGSVVRLGVAGPDHALHALLTGERNRYLLRFGTVEKLATAFKNAYD
jgi:hypothetical protein